MPPTNRSAHRQWRRSLLIAAAVGAIFALAVPESGEGQTTPLRDGQWLGVGFGGGLDQISCDICAGDPKPGFAGYVRFGGTLSSRLLIGGELNGWTRSDEAIQQYLGSLSAVFLWYTRPEGSLYLKGGLGAVGYRAEEDGDALTALTLGGQVGVGYEHRIGDNLSLTPFASLVLAPFAGLSFNGDPATDGATLALLQGGLGLTWH
jgi:hypothetical protein